MSLVRIPDSDTMFMQQQALERVRQMQSMQQERIFGSNQAGSSPSFTQNQPLQSGNMQSATRSAELRVGKECRL